MRKRKLLIAILLFLFLSVAYYFSLPTIIFSDPYSSVLYARKGELLTASIAQDGQWRFPQSTTLSPKFVQALVAYEDKRFFNHWGVDARAFARAIQQNWKAKKVVSGGSTISMQVIRLSRKGQQRTLWQKLIEVVLATRLELRYTKSEILNLYASHAPFGGNVVGVEAACWRYFGRDIQELSWGEAALLAVLPNAPSLIHPGKNRILLEQKRNALLDRLQALKVIDAFTCTLAKSEPIPEKPQVLPRHARHILLRLKAAKIQQTKQQLTIDFPLQKVVEDLVQNHAANMSSKKIDNAAAIVLNVKTGEVLAYVGNVSSSTSSYHSNEVDIISSPRSTGSILKPFLYAAMLDEGKILPKSLIEDVPTFINGFAPKNFSKSYDGAIPANEALIRSLNIPAVHMLQDYRYEKFHVLLKQMGMSTLSKPADHYGLSLILGGAEGSLWDITGMYASMGRTLNNYFTRPGINKYDKKDFHPPVYQLKDSINSLASTNELESNTYLSAAAIYHTLDALTEVYRPGEESGWRYFDTSKKIAWKTGTSYGYRDAWALGVTPEYAVGVWVGNADGEGRPGLTGTDAASPLLFSIFSQLPATSWFQKPLAEMQSLAVCAKSGYRLGPYCETSDTSMVIKSSLKASVCTYHQRVHLSADQQYQVSSQCQSVAQMVHKNWFVLPPVQAYYYREKNLSYKPLPPIKLGCAESKIFMELIYPKPNAKIYIPRVLAGSTSNIVFELAHYQPSTKVYWHLDGDYVGTTKGMHQMALSPQKGKHILTLVDENGQSLARTFEVLSGM